MNKKIFFAGLISVFVLLSTYLIARPIFVFSEDMGGNNAEIDELNRQIAEKKEKIKQLEQSIEDYKKKVQQTQSQAVSLSNQIAIIDNYTAQIELDIQATQEKLGALTLEIESLGLSISEKEKVIERQKIILGELVRTLYYENNKKYIEILAAYDSFSDFYSRVHYVKNVERDMGESTKTIRLAKEDLEDIKQQTEERKKTYEELKQKLNNRKKDLDEQSEYKEQLLIATKSSGLQYKTQLSNLRKIYQQIEGEISSIEQQVRRRLEEEQRFSGIEDNAVFSWPTQSRYITAYFHDEGYPYRNIFEHPAVDVRASHGTAVRAAKSGYIGRARTCTTASCYAYVMIIHAGGFSTVYGHLSSIAVAEDQFVAVGDVVGYSGATPGTVGAGPFTTGPHLHFEIRKNGIPVNPLNYLVKDW